MAVRNYSNVVVPQVLTAPAGATDVTIQVGSTTSFPPPPFLLGLDRGTQAAEVCLCTDVPSSTTFTVVRGYDNTTAVSHAAETGTVEHCSSAIDLREPNAFINLLADQGDIIAYGAAGAVRLGAGPAGSLLMVDPTQAAGLRWGNDAVLGPWSEELVTIANSGAAATLDLSQAREFNVTLTANCTFTIANAPATAARRLSFGVALVQDGVGSRTVTWPSSVDWGVYGAPQLSTTAGATDFVGFISDTNGTKWLGFTGGLGY
jgi:hypothetical protein